MATQEQAPSPPVAARRRASVRRPLAPLTYLVRNIGKTIPLTAVIMLAVLLVSGVIAMMNSIPYSIRTIYSYSKETLGISPRGDPTQTMRLVQEVQENSPVPIERIVICRASSSQVRSIVGKWPFLVLGLEQKDIEYYLKRQGSKGIEGRLPKPGAAEAVISKPVAENLDLKIGSAVQKPDENESYSPKPVKVVGIADTDRWLMVGSVEYQRENHFPPIDFAMIFAGNLQDQDKLDRWADEHFKGQRAQIWAYHQIEKNTKEMFATLYQVLNVVIGTLVLVITFMMGMLMNIYQSQRLVEFGLLQAIGYTKKQLLTRVIAEAIAVVLIGWAMGVVLSYFLLNVAKRVLMDPNAYALDTQDVVAFSYTIPIPIAILIVAVATVVLRFRKFDPVGVVERRLV
ncbi:MAG: ABC transporter permease [Fimbriimonas sp.]